MKFLYKYPQHKFPYEQLVEESLSRNPDDAEFELLDTGIFDDDRYWDVFIEVSFVLSCTYGPNIHELVPVREGRG